MNGFRQDDLNTELDALNEERPTIGGERQDPSAKNNAGGAESLLFAFVVKALYADLVCHLVYWGTSVEHPDRGLWRTDLHISLKENRAELGRSNMYSSLPDKALHR